MAKRRAAAKAGNDDDDNKVKPSEVRQVISAKKLKELMGSVRRTRNETTEIAGQLGSEIKQAVEKHFLNRKVFRVICTLDKMENEDIADWLEDFEHYLDISGIGKRAQDVQPLGLRGEGSEDAEGEGESNIADFPAGAAARH